MRSFQPFLDGYHDVADQLRAHLWRRAGEAFDRTEAEKDGIASVAAFAARRDRLRRLFLDAVGGLPELPPEVPAVCTGRLAGPGFTVEKLLLETLPSTWATALFYLPAAPPGPWPCVLFLCGHHRAAKAVAEYQRVCRALARAGLAVLALDPVGQGERLQYVDPQTGKEHVPWGTAEHCHAGLQCHVAGFGIARYFLADAWQAVSYLRGRPEVDPARVGVTGNSGGGTQACYLMLLDGRLACGAPCTYVTTRQAYLATGQAHDAEQNVRGAILGGLDYDDLVSGLAPRPVLVGATASDFFAVEGALGAYDRLRAVYHLHGMGSDVHLVVAPGTHAFSPLLRQHVVRFFRRYLRDEPDALAGGCTILSGPEEAPRDAVACAAAPDASGGDDEEEVWPERDLQVTMRGQVLLDRPGSRTVFDLNLEAWRRRPVPPRGPAGALARLRRDVLAERPRSPLWVREVARGESDGVTWSHRYAFSEPDVVLPMALLERPGGGAPAGSLAVLALPEGTAGLDGRRSDLRRLVVEHGRVLLFDPRGTGAGAQRPINAHPPAGRYGTVHRLNYDAMMLGDSLLAMWAFDALRALEYAHRIATWVVAVGEGTPGLALLVAAVLDGEIAAARMRRLPRAFADLVTERLHQADLVLEVHGLAAWPEVSELLALLPDAQAEEWVDARGRVLTDAGVASAPP